MLQEVTATRQLEQFLTDNLKLSHYRAAMVVAYYRFILADPVTPEKVSQNGNFL